jgi:DNA-binding transcriptional ArsR family regulator
VATVTVGVVGPGDLVELVIALRGGPADVSLVPFIYEHEEQASRLVTAAQDQVDGLLFTGVVPYAQARVDGVLRRPAEHVSYSGATLLRALVEQLRLGHDAATLSIDTLTRAQVIETMTEARLPTDRVRVLEYRAGITSEEVVAFHRAARDESGTKLAITCLGSAYRVLEQEMHAVRLAPSRHSIREALRHLVLTVSNLRTGDAQVAIGLIDLDGASDAELQRSISPLGGALARLDDVYLVVSTAGLLEQATSHYQDLPLLERLSSRHEQVHIGFGVGRTAAEAQSLARRALGRSRAVGPTAVAVALADDTDIILNGGRSADPELLPPDDLSLLARRAGLNLTTLRQLRELSAQRPAEQELITASDIAEYLGVQERTARRVVKRLERAGIAEVVSARRDGHSGRPRLLYRIRL